MRDRFEMLFEHCVDGVFFMTLDEPIAWDQAADKDALLDYAFDHLRTTSVNRVMCEIQGVSRDELIGTVPRERWKIDIPVWRARMRELYDRGRTFFTMRAPRSDGRWVDVEGQYVCIYDERGRITGCFGTQRDITEKRKTDDRLELALESGDIAIWDLDLTTQALYFDDRFLCRMGYAAHDPRVHTSAFWATCIHESDMPEIARTFEAHLAGELPLFRIEHRLRTASGEWRWIMSSGRVTSRDDDNRPLRLVGSCLDITERKQLHERLFLAERMASLGTLAAGVGHEINNPLTYVVLNLTLLERELKTLDLAPATQTRLRHMIEQARYGTTRVTGIVRDLQALTRVPDEGASRVDVRTVLERCLEIGDHQIRYRARVIRELADVPAVHGSEGRIVQLFLNLIVNAAQAIPEGAAETNTITIATSVDDAGRIVVSITDSGVGIAPDVLGRIFDPFYTTKQVGEGTGLGLAICRSIVIALGGEIEVDSTPGRGSTFRVTLPAAPAVLPPERRSAPRVAAKKRVLVIDDEPLVGQLVCKVLADHDVVAETSPRAALSRLRTDEAFDLILCDVMMPEVSGMDFYDLVGGVDPSLRNRIVFLSGGAFTERAQTFLDSVPNRRLDKPFDVEALTAVLLSSGDQDALP